MRGRAADVGLEGQGNVAGAAQPVHGVNPGNNAGDKGEYDNGISLILLFGQLFKNSVVGFVPGDFFPLRVNANAFFRIRALERNGDAVGVVEPA